MATPINHSDAQAPGNQVDNSHPKSEYSPYIEIVEAGLSKSGKTKVWHVVNKDHVDDVPGVISWNGGWRKYVYYSNEAYYDWKCLRQIADFIETATKEHKL